MAVNCQKEVHVQLPRMGHLRYGAILGTLLQIWDTLTCREEGPKLQFGVRTENQWDPKYGCRGTVTARFALIAFVAWKRLADSTLGKLLVHPEYV